MARRRANAPGPAPGGTPLMQRASFQFTPRGGSSTHRPCARAAAPPSAAEQFEAEGAGETLSAYADRWLNGVRGAVRQRTFDSYSMQLRLHVLPALGQRQIDELSVEDILLLIEKLRAAGY